MQGEGHPKESGYTREFIVRLGFTFFLQQA